MPSPTSALFRQNAVRVSGYPIAATLVAALLCGCGSNGSSVGTVAGGVQLVRFNGTVHGGQQPISGATIQLYSVGTTGTASTATPLIASTVTTNANGAFSITGTYSCASATQVYLVATGGNSGAGSNPSISEMAALGACSALTPSTFINMNELTTIAGVYALAPFMADYAHIGASGSNPTGLVNAFNTANLLVSSGTGAPSTVPAGMTLPITRMNTLANIVASCINTSSASSPYCSSLFAVTGATETIGATLAIAQNPGSSTTTGLFSLTSPTTISARAHGPAQRLHSRDQLYGR